jgi:hypothetical protein
MHERVAGDHLSHLLPALQWLDQLLHQALAVAHDTDGLNGASDPYQGLHATLEEMEQLLRRAPGQPPLLAVASKACDTLIRLLAEPSPLRWLQQAHSLSAFDLAVVVLALAPEIDRRYERLYAFLQENITHILPSVDLVLSLLCDSAATKLIMRSRFAPDAPLIQQGLVQLLPDPDRARSTLLGHQLVLDAQIIRFLLGYQGVDSRLASFCQLVQPESVISLQALPPESSTALLDLASQLWHARTPICLYFQGIDQHGQRQTAELIAAQLQVQLLDVDLSRWLEPNNLEATLHVLMREADFQNAALYVHRLDAWNSQERLTHLRLLLQALSSHSSPWLIAGPDLAWELNRSQLRSITIPFVLPAFSHRLTCWQRALSDRQISLDEAHLHGLADSFRLFPSQIMAAVDVAIDRLHWTTMSSRTQQELPQSPEQPIQADDLYAAAREQSGQDLSSMAKKVGGRCQLKDLVLPPDQHKQLHEICQHITCRHRVHSDWGFASKLTLGKGLNVLFYGPPGTGKTMAAEALANELNLDLYKIDLSQIVSKYIGETEKSLNKIFNAAEAANCILLFDEADAILGKRSEVKDAHDRYANLEISFLLQKMEEYEGMSILTTNLRQNLDQAFTRRIRFMVEFPFPNPDYRELIWQTMWSDHTPLSGNIDFRRIAQKFELAGGSIRNSALAAAFLAASAQEDIHERHILQAVKRELQKLGRLIDELDF